MSTRSRFPLPLHLSPCRWILVALLSVVLFPGAALAQDAEAPWPMFRHDAQRTGATSLRGPANPEVRWRFDLGGYAYSSPSIAADGSVYVGSADSIYAINPTGTRRWARAVPVDDYAIASPFVAADGAVFVGSRDGRMYALREQGAALSVQPTVVGAEVWTSALPVADGAVVFGAFDGGVYRLQRAEGTYALDRIFDTRAGGDPEIIASPALGADGTVYVATLAGRLYAITPDGTPVWDAPFVAGDELFATPVVAQDEQGRDQAVIAAGRGGMVYALDPSSGTPLWDFDAGSEFVASPAVRGSTLYVVTLAGTLTALDLVTGGVQWSRDLGGQVTSSPAVDADGVVYVGSLNHTLYAVDAGGAPLWQRTLDGPIWSSPAIGHDRELYVATAGTETVTGKLYAFRDAAFRVEPTVAVAEAGTAIVVTAEAEELPQSVTLYARRGGTRAYVEIPMAPATGAGVGRFEGRIPESLVTGRGVEYYVRIVFAEHEATFPSVNPASAPATLRVRVPEAEPAGVFAAKQYRMVSVPLEAADPSLEAVFADDYGPYRRDLWRLLRWDGSDYREPPELEAQATPGTAFLLITQWGAPFTVGEALSVDTAQPFRITLQPGWNQIGNPFAFPVAWRDVIRDPEAVAPGNIAVFKDGGWVQDPAMLDTLRLMPWEGALVYNASNEPATLAIPPVEAGASGSDKRLAGGGFSLALHAYAAGDGGQDTQNWIGFEGAGVGDMPEAPPVASGVRLSIVEDGRAYARRVKPLPEAGARWTVRLHHAASQHRTVTLRLMPDGALPDGFGIYVVDPAAGRLLPLENNRLELPLEAGHERTLEVVIGTEAYVQAQHPTATDLPMQMTLGANYPDPFRAETTIPYAVPEQRHVRLDVFNVLGQRVARLVDGPQEAGHHHVVWDGRDDLGRPVASGVYICRLTSGAVTTTKTMVVLR